MLIGVTNSLALILVAIATVGIAAYAALVMINPHAGPSQMVSSTIIQGGSVTFTLVVVLLLVGFIYFIPSIIAFHSRAGNRSAVLFLNLFLGWTLLGWIISLFWALAGASQATAIRANYKKCPRCAEAILNEARICRFCQHQFNQ
ncbi:superinfection immunity protein [Nitrospirillum iridis]|uniref:superinfection immunity protein n=1 Tax=Nitrospirillum iridis TaxID=765888 RepID=UPI003CCD578D